MDLVLWQIEDGLLALSQRREEILEQIADELREKAVPGQDASALVGGLVAELEFAENAIQVYMTAEIRKVDGIRDYIRGCEEMAEAAEKEAKAMAARAKSWRGRLDHIKTVVASVMAEFQWKTGKPRKLEGRTGSISLRGNGGVQPLNVYNADLVPEELKTITVRMALTDWRFIEGLAKKNEQDIPITACVVSVEPNNEAVRRALAEKCEECHGSGEKCCNPDHSRPTDCDERCRECSYCGGSGFASVPGARLEPRGVHVQVS